MKEIPTDQSIESTLNFNSEGYNFISNRCEQLNTDVFLTKLLLKDVICLRGEEAAKLFYNNDVIKREGAVPEPTKSAFLGKEAPHGLDDETHKHRKRLFMSPMTREGIENHVKLMIKYWDIYLDKWEKMDQINFYKETCQLNLEAVCEWCEIPLKKEEVKERAEELASLADGAVNAGIKNIKGRINIKRAEEWLRGIIDDVRKGNLEVSEDSVLKKFATFRDLKGELLDHRIAATSMINLLRPTVQLGRWFAFMAVAFEEYPENKEKVRKDDEYVEYFVQEVRRFYPFIPFALGKTRKEVEWKGYRIPNDTNVLLDVYGTDRDEKSWKDADEFKPERFKTWDQSPYNFIPHGGGSFYEHHRCPGEWTTIEAMKLAAKIMTRSMKYELPEQDLSISLTQLPAIPKSGVIMKNIKKLDTDLKVMEYKYTRKESAET